MNEHILGRCMSVYLCVCVFFWKEERFCDASHFLFAFIFNNIYACIYLLFLRAHERVCAKFALVNISYWKEERAKGVSIAWLKCMDTENLWKNDDVTA